MSFEMLRVGGLTDQGKAPEVGCPSNRSMGSVWIPLFCWFWGWWGNLFILY